jgi:hypothetical protein
MAERTIATVLKTVGVQAPGGSNPPPSALFSTRTAGSTARSAAEKIEQQVGVVHEVRVADELRGDPLLRRRTEALS